MKGLDCFPSRAITCLLYCVAALDASNIALTGVVLPQNNSNGDRNKGRDGKELDVHSENRDGSDSEDFERGYLLEV